MEHYTEFLPISRADMEARGWDQLDFVVVGGDAYVDHPSFGTAIISRLLEAEGYKVGVLAQPRYTDCLSLIHILSKKSPHERTLSAKA